MYNYISLRCTIEWNKNSLAMIVQYFIAVMLQKLGVLHEGQPALGSQATKLFVLLNFVYKPKVGKQN